MATVRVHLTARDLARTRIARGPSLAVELRLAAATAQLPGQLRPGEFDDWQRSVSERLAPETRTVLSLLSAARPCPPFVVPGAVRSAGELREEVLRTPRRRVREELSGIAEYGHVLPRWTSALGDDPRALAWLAGTLEEVYTQALEPHWPRIQAVAAADRADRAARMADEGVESLLAGLNPGRVSWRPPVLELAFPCVREQVDIRLRGQGLLLVPSLFAAAVGAIDAREEAFTVVYPVRYAPSCCPLSAPAGPVPLGPFPEAAALLGRTRAAVLAATAHYPGSTTTELARRAGIAPASASAHTAVLRSGGLVSTVRDYRGAHHSPTAEGLRLLGPRIPGTGPGR
ncbi:winged helix-turn-helix domain-containing protein [Streptomyces boncukensis]|uniref:Helix-turn-helix domain-containing protein n=1 Tax=Streptomyces boncukensis TaxID=2711219 RepID=A0A6G4WXL3_9ACTN|nr:helix-turn-helix domain-containing protein [Streptomyces boncukensis]NGO69264.1 helix-turn-helix domain-containing protein [Streptomyces boncukensis]